MDTLRVLDTTLRDGSYVSDFMFTAADTESLVRALDLLNVPLIEIGHGVGINACNKVAPAAESDVGYVKAARRASRNSKIAMFCIPGVAGLDDMLRCIDAGLQVVRVGTNVRQYREMGPFIELARKRGVVAYANYMKSYLATPMELAEIGRASADMGAHGIFLVDSAGALMPRVVTEYITRMRASADVPVGFHGHNNLGLAVANCLAAIDAGATIIDATLSGIGRSSGNPPTEIIVALLQREYHACKNIDACAPMELAERAVGRLASSYPLEVPITTALGLGQVHSAFLPKIRDSAQAKQRQIYDTILKVGDIDRLDLPPAVLDRALATARPVSQVGDAHNPPTTPRDCMFR